MMRRAAVAGVRLPPGAEGVLVRYADMRRTSSFGGPFHADTDERGSGGSRCSAAAGRAILSGVVRPIVLLAPFAAALSATVALAAPAAEGARNSPPAHVELRVAVFGNDPCPTGAGDEIVVCARLPEAERYRVPKRLRDEKAAAKATEQAWGARVRDIDATGDDQRPDSCSAVGSGGQTGCFQKFMRDARAQKAADAAAASDVP